MLPRRRRVVGLSFPGDLLASASMTAILEAVRPGRAWSSRAEATISPKFSVLGWRFPCVGAGFGCCGLVGVWLRAEFDVEQRERFGLDVVGRGEAGEGVRGFADAQLAAADGAEFGDQVGEVVGR